MQIHTVKKSDTLWKLAQQYGVSTNDLIRANQLTNPENLVVGQAVIIPSSAYSHQVRSGETLWSISQRYGVTIQELVRVNHLNNPAVIYPGQMIEIPQPYKPTIEVNGYTEIFGEDGVQLTNEIAEHLTYLSPFSYRVQSDGSLTELDDTAIIRAAYDKRTAPMMVLTNFEDGTFSSDLAHTVLTNTTVQDQMISNVLGTMQMKGYMALNIDFEYVPPADRLRYNQLLQRLVDTLHPHGFLVSSAVAPKLSADQKGTLYEAHDYAEHGRILDFVIIMTYEWGWSGGPPLAVAPLNEVVKVLKYAMSVIPAEKIMMGMPLYGYDWTLPYVKGGKWAPTISPQDAVNRAAQYGSEIHFDSESQSPYFNYYDEQGLQHVVWFEDARSVQAKFNVVKVYKLRGVSYWVLGVAFPQNWYVLEENFHIRKLVK